MTRDAVTAIHEAGHAVAMIATHQSFRYLTLNPRDPGLDGMVRRYGLRRVQQWDHSLSSLAGPCAELHLILLGEYPGYTGSGHPSEVKALAYNLWCWREDDDEVAGADSQDLPLADGVTEAAWMVTNLWWPSILRVATASLAAPRALSHKDVVDLADHWSALRRKTRSGSSVRAPDISAVGKSAMGTP